MNKIHLLKDDVINKIAAGEVVVRPANVVKELVENAIDAHSSEISINLDEGGIKSIIVRDNGKGISKEDLPLALTRHATSKISKAEDLYKISSMGFRGEALASIGSVSKFSISSRQTGTPSGHSIAMMDGHEKILPWNGPEGTTVKCNDLFYNIPARAKFLKSSATEYAHISEMVQAISLTNPAVSFTLSHNGKEKFSSPSAEIKSEKPFKGEEALRKKASAIFGKDVVEELLYVKDENQYAQFEGLISPPGLERATGKSIYTFVNERWVKDQTLRYGVLRGYHSHLLKGRFPIALIFIYSDPSLVDANVHPAKTEVKFQYPSEVQGQIAISIRKKLREGNWASSETTTEQQTIDMPSTSMAPSQIPQPKSFGDYDLKTSHSPSSNYQTTTPSSRGQDQVTYKRESFRAPEDFSTTITSDEPQMTLDEPTIPWVELQYVGAFAKCYLFFEVRDRLLAIDQHAFHERILYERLIRDQALLKSTQDLLIPEEIILGETETAYLVESKEKLKALGFAYKKTSDTCIELTKIPSLLSGKDVQGVISKLADNGLDESRETSDLSFLHLATIACHSAVRAGEVLGENELRVLLNEATDVDFYHNCPHGRRVFKWLKKSEVEHWFDR